MKRILHYISPIVWGYKPKGLLPIQSEGYFLGYYFYFRYRYGVVKMDFSENKEDWWGNGTMYHVYLNPPDDEYCISKSQCIRLIYKGCLCFLFYKLFKIQL